MNLTFVDAKNLDEAWFRCLFNLFDGDHHTYLVDSGSFAGDTRKEFDWVTIRISNPGGDHNIGLRRLIPTVPYGVPAPCDEDKVLDYFSNYLFSAELRPDEQYTYGSRIVGEADQVNHIIDAYKKNGYGSNQMIIQVGKPDDNQLEDPPCLRHIDTRIRYGKLHFMPYFRSWDLWGGLPLNLAGIQLLKEYMAAEIGVEDGSIIATSKGLHVYGHAEDVARLRAGVSKKGNGE